jgi:hypothetical protein
MPSHRALALLRGRNEGMLRLSRWYSIRTRRSRSNPGPNPCEQRIAVRTSASSRQGRPADKWLADTVRWTWKVKVSTHLELELMNELRERAEEEAIRVFAATCTTCCSPPRRPARHHGPRPRHPHRRARWRSSTPPASCSTDRHHLSARAAPRLGRRARTLARWRRSTGRADRHRQRHRQPRDRQAAADLIKRHPNCS